MGKSTRSKGHVYLGLPTTIRVGPFDLRIRIHVFDDVDTSGDHAHGELTIRLNPHQANSHAFAVDTLLHELCHAIHRTYGLTVGDTEERYCSTMGTALTQILRDNPKLLTWLTKALRK